MVGFHIQSINTKINGNKIRYRYWDIVGRHKIILFSYNGFYMVYNLLTHTQQFKFRMQNMQIVSIKYIGQNKIMIIDSIYEQILILNYTTNTIVHKLSFEQMENQNQKKNKNTYRMLKVEQYSLLWATDNNSLKIYIYQGQQTFFKTFTIQANRDSFLEYLSGNRLILYNPIETSEEFSLRVVDTSEQKIQEFKCANFCKNILIMRILQIDSTRVLIVGNENAHGVGFIYNVEEENDNLESIHITQNLITSVIEYDSKAEVIVVLSKIHQYKQIKNSSKKIGDVVEAIEVVNLKSKVKSNSVYCPTIIKYHYDHQHGILITQHPSQAPDIYQFGLYKFVDNKSLILNILLNSRISEKYELDTLARDLFALNQLKH